MTDLDTRIPSIDPQYAISNLLQKLGFWRTFAALIVVAFKQRSRPPDQPDYLDDHIRKDIGLPPIAHDKVQWRDGYY